MGSYLVAIAVLLMVLSPLFIPIGVTVVPMMASGLRRIARALGIYRPAPRPA